MKYCLQCDWHVSSTDDLETTTQSRKAIDHFVETGHAIESVAIVPTDAAASTGELLGEG